MRDLFERIGKNLSEVKASLESQKYNLALNPLEEIKEDYDILRSELQREKRLSQIERDLYSSPKSLDKTLAYITNIIKNEFGFSRFDIVIMDYGLKRVMRRYSLGGFGEADLEKLARHGALNVTRDYCLENKEPWIVNNIKEQDPLWELALELDVWIHGTFPLYEIKKNRNKEKEELVGYLHGARTKKDFLDGKILTDKEVEELKRLGWAITKAIKEAKLSYFQRTVMNIQNIIGSTRMEISDFQEFQNKEKNQDQMNIVLDYIIETLDASFGGILIKEKNQIEPYLFRNDKRQIISTDKIKFSPSKIGFISNLILNGCSVIENELTKEKNKMDLRIIDSPDTQYTLIASPLIKPYSEEGSVLKNVIGAIVFLNKKDECRRLIKTDFESSEGGFFTVDSQILESISPYIETVISNTRSHRELKRLSLTDGLTELANRTHFMRDLLALEFKRSKRYSTPLSILLIDIDHFKVFNDVFGHQVGDLVLIELAAILRENTRSVDHLARYGGEEFAIILHNTTLEDAILYAEKIRKKVSQGNYVKKIQKEKLFNIFEAKKRLTAILTMEDENVRNAKISVMKHHFGLDVEEIAILINEGKMKEAEEKILNTFCVTISIGLAFYPDTRISTKRDLVTTVDMLLLQAKESGRNRVESVDILT